MSYKISLDNTGADNSGLSNTSLLDKGSKSSCSSEVIVTKLISSNRVGDVVLKGTLNVVMISICQKKSSSV